MAMEYIRKSYGVPAKRGMRVRYTGHHSGPKEGRITRSRGPYLLILLDGEKFSKPYHPTWEIEYLTGTQN